MIERDRPYSRIVDGLRIPGFFSQDLYRSGLEHRPEAGEVVLVTFPKCGTHLVLKILQAAHQVCQDVALGTVFLEMMGLEGIKKCARPRIVFTHLPLSLAPFSSDAKYIYVTRNPKDCCVSYYHHTKVVPAYNFHDGSFSEFFEIFLDGQTDFGSYYESVRSWYAKKNAPNVLFLTYEDICADIRASVLKITRFVDESVFDDLSHNDHKMKAVLRASNFATMRKELDPQFIRKGIVGDWKNHFSPEQSRRLEQRFFHEVEGTDIAELWKGTDWLLDIKQYGSCRQE